MKHDLLQPEILRTEEELVVELAGRICGGGGQKRVAADLGLSQGELSHAVSGKRGVTPNVAAALGYRKVTRFERVE